MNINPIEDRLAIRELVEMFTIGCMRADSGLWGSTWVDEASWKIDAMDVPTVGKSNVIAFFEKIMGNIEFVTMSSFPSGLVIDSDKAHGKTYSQELLFPKAGGQKILVGCYDDEYVKRGGRWYFLSRIYDTMWRSVVATG